ncbi:hypothetical protein FY048_11630 [Acinetobacter sp. 1124_18A]|uniref:hypothetical protein n=1 Tax=Acinetobacter sp. 1124_18A TaxID=2605958 RepID=UPI004058BF17
MNSSSLNRYDYFIDSACVKLILGECFGIIFMLFSIIIFMPDIFDSDKWLAELFGISISLYYLYPVVVGLVGLIYLLKNFFKYYRYTVFKFHVEDGFVVFKILGLKNIKFDHFNIIANHYRIGHWNGFKKEYFNCIGVTNNKKLYLIPVIDSKQDELIQILITHGGEMIE